MRIETTKAEHTKKLGIPTRGIVPADVAHCEALHVGLRPAIMRWMANFFLAVLGLVSGEGYRSIIRSQTIHSNCSMETTPHLGERPITLWRRWITPCPRRRTISRQSAICPHSTIPPTRVAQRRSSFTSGLPVSWRASSADTRGTTAAGERTLLSQGRRTPSSWTSFAVSGERREIDVRGMILKL